ncbi:MAG: hypothetical protein NXI01_08685 [Gammaproteobacteria bacterium]|nr:hypothetical protein [Gammaproteobacteria bacterium]
MYDLDDIFGHDFIPESVWTSDLQALEQRLSALSLLDSSFDIEEPDVLEFKIALLKDQMSDLNLSFSALFDNQNILFIGPQIPSSSDRNNTAFIEETWDLQRNNNASETTLENAHDIIGKQRHRIMQHLALTLTPKKSDPAVVEFQERHAEALKEAKLEAEKAQLQASIAKQKMLERQQAKPTTDLSPTLSLKLPALWMLSGAAITTISTLTYFNNAHMAFLLSLSIPHAALAAVATVGAAMFVYSAYRGLRALCPEKAGQSAHSPRLFNAHHRDLAPNNPVYPYGSFGYGINYRA